MYRWENDKFSEIASGLNLACGNQTVNELIFVGGIDSNMWLDNGKQLSRNFKQGYRVYSSEGIACSITSNGGGFGACTGLYLMWLNETFQRKNLGVNYEWFSHNRKFH